MTRIAVILGHPVAGSFNAALADRYAEAAAQAGHEIRRITVGDLDMIPVNRTGFGAAEQEPDLIAARETLGWAEHWAIFWPLWLGDQPAVLKGFWERALIPGFAMEKVKGPPFYKPLLGGRSARVVVTMQMPVFVYRLLAGSRATRILRKQILEFIGVKPVRETIFGGVDAASDEKRAGWLARVAELGAGGA